MWPLPSVRSRRLLVAALVSVLAAGGCAAIHSSLRIHSRLQPGLSITVDGIRVNYTASLRPGDDGPVVVLIHGFGASLESWRDIYPELAKEHSVIRLDLKGAGFSDKPSDGHYAPVDQASLVLKFVRQLGLAHVVLAGHSLGGGIAILTTIAAIREDEPGLIAGLVLIDAAAYPQPLPFFVEMLRSPLTQNIAKLTSATFRTRFVLNRTFVVKDRVTDDRVYRYAYFLTLPGTQEALEATATALRYEAADTLNTELGQLEMPTLIIWGARDPVFPVGQAARLHQAIVNSSVVILPETGHAPHEERPDETARAIDDFLARIPWAPERP
jgi:pimeloyl-ACP methyl ester carboxylesterase